MRWDDTAHEWVMDVSVVSQHDLSTTLGALSGVDPSRCMLDEGYYTDTRVSARVATVMPEGEDDGYVADARLRITLSVPSRGWSRELFCGYVTVTPEESVEDGAVIRTYELDSTLYGIAEDLIPWQVTCGQGASMLASFRWLLDVARMPYDTTGARDRLFGSTVFYEIGDSMLHMLFDMTGSTDRIGVSGHGDITLRPYVAPSEATPVATIDDDDPLTLSVGAAKRTSKAAERPGRAIVTSNQPSPDGSGSVTLAGWYDSPATSPSSSARRGYTRAVKRSYEGSSEHPSVDELNAEARRYWSDSQGEGVEWERSVLYMDLHAGDVVSFAPHGRERRKCLVTAARTNFGDMTQDLTLEEV